MKSFPVVLYDEIKNLTFKPSNYNEFCTEIGNLFKIDNTEKLTYEYQTKDNKYFPLNVLNYANFYWNDDIQKIYIYTSSKEAYTYNLNGIKNNFYNEVLFPFKIERIFSINDNYDATIKKLREDNKELINKLNEKTGENHSLRFQLKNEKEKLINSIGKIKEELNNEKNKNIILNKKVIELEQLINLKNNEIKGLNKEKDNNRILNIKVTELEQLINLKNNEIKGLNNEKNNNRILNIKVTELEKIIGLKNNEIAELKKSNKKIYSINFTSTDQKILNYSLICKNTDIFVKLEQQLYEDFPEYKNKETYFMKNAVKINRFKSLDENNIKKNDVIILNTYD